MEKRNNNNLIEVTPKKALKNLMILTLLLINIPSQLKKIHSSMIVQKMTYINMNIIIYAIFHVQEGHMFQKQIKIYVKINIK